MITLVLSPLGLLRAWQCCFTLHFVGVGKVPACFRRQSPHLFSLSSVSVCLMPHFFFLPDRLSSNFSRLFSVLFSSASVLVFAMFWMLHWLVQSGQSYLFSQISSCPYRFPLYYSIPNYCIHLLMLFIGFVSFFSEKMHFKRVIVHSAAPF